MRFSTKSGSHYEVDGRRIRRFIRSSASESERVGEDWRKAVVGIIKVGSPVVIYWGEGLDEFSPESATEECNVRLTVTTQVREIYE